MTERQEKISKTLNEFFKDNYTTFNQLNHVVSERYDRYKDLDLIVNDYKQITVLSLIASITEDLCGDRLAFNCDEFDRIVGVSWFFESNPHLKIKR